MQYLYETLLIVTPEAGDDTVAAVIGDLRAAIETDGGVVLQAGVWERRKLAYAVKGKTEGIYVLIYADGNPSLPAVLKDRMRLDESVIRSMVVRLENQHEADTREQIAATDHSEDAAAIEAQRIAAQRRHEADAAAAAMSLDEIAAAKAAQAVEAVDEAADAEGDAEEAGVAAGAAPAEESSVAGDENRSEEPQAADAGDEPEAVVEADDAPTDGTSDEDADKEN